MDQQIVMPWGSVVTPPAAFWQLPLDVQQLAIKTVTDLGTDYRRQVGQPATVAEDDPGRVPSPQGSIQASDFVKPVAPDKPASSFDAQSRLMFPWIPEALRGVFLDAWDRYGDPNLALDVLRQDKRYDEFFPGNRRADGTVRLPEGDFLSTMEGFDRELGFFGLDGKDFVEQKRKAVENGVSPSELAARLGTVYTGVVTQGDQTRAYYAQKYGAGGLSNQAIFASAIDGKTSPLEFQRRITASQIGGNAAQFGFDLNVAEADRLAAFGLTDQASSNLFAQASKELPRLGELQQRFNDPSDPLTIEQYDNALVLNDPKQLDVFQRLYGRQRSLYSPSGGAATDQSGRQTGLLAR